MKTQFAYARTFLILLLFFATGQSAWSGQIPWPDANFTYLAAHERIGQVYEGFARTFGISIQLSALSDTDQALVNGKINTATPTEFLNQMCAAYGMSWFYQNGTLYVSKNTERVVRAIQPPGMQIESMRNALIALGLLETKFGWGEIQDRGIALISGPPAYVDIITQAVATLPSVIPEQQIEVFRLRHAQAEDRTVFFRDKKIITPGVATILRNLVSGENRKGISNIQLTEAPKLMAQGDPLTTTATASSDAAGVPIPQDQPALPKKMGAVVPSATPGWLGTEQRSSIQSDSLLNAVIVRDRPDRIQVYKQLIASLDVPSEQVEIEAVVIDINSSKLVELGIDWNAGNGANSIGFGQPSLPAGPTTLSFVRNPVGVVANVGNFLVSRIQLLESTGDAKIVSRLPLLTMDNVGAVIDSSDTIYVQTTTTSNSGSNLGALSNTSTTANEALTVGATLRVTPHIIHDGTKQAVELFIDIDDSGIQNISTSGSLPTVRRTTIGTQAIVTDNEGLLIGGFKTEQNMKQKDAVPILSDIPLIGALFRKTTTTEQKMERVFLITPRIKASPVM